MSTVARRNEGQLDRGHVRSRGGGAVLLAVTGLAVAVVAASLAAAGPAGAGGMDPITPARDRYEPGQTVVMIGYGSAGAIWRERKGPVYAWLRVDPAAAAAGPDALIVHPTDRRVAPVVVEELARPDRTHRASITFDLPDTLRPGTYGLAMCDDPCTNAALGALWPEPVHVGVDPAYPVVRDWPLDEPMIRWLEDDALIRSPWGEEMTAADVRAGRVQPPPPALPAPDADDERPHGAWADGPPDTVSGSADATASRSRVGAQPAGGGARATTADGTADVAGEALPDAPAGDHAHDGWDAGRLLLLVGAAVVACTLIGARHMLRPARRSRHAAGRSATAGDVAAADDERPHGDTSDDTGRTGDAADDEGPHGDARDDTGRTGGDRDPDQPVAPGAPPGLETVFVPDHDPEAVLVPDREIEPESARPAHRQSARVRTRARTRDRTGDRTRARL